MKLLLVNPPQPSAELTTKALKDLNPILPSLGLMYIASAARRAGFDVELYDAQIRADSVDQAVDEIVRRGADLVGITCWTCNAHRVASLCAALKQRAPTPIVLGGPHVTMHAQACIDDPHVDFVVVGEGEVTLVELLRVLADPGAGIDRSDRLHLVLGLGYRVGGQGVLNPKRPMIQDLDQIPFPAWDLVDPAIYRPAPQHYRKLPSVSMITSRGCPFSCTFCDSVLIWTRKYRLRSVANVLAEIQWLHREYGVSDINFWDDLWGINRKWALELCRRLREEGPPDLTWTCECRVDTVTPEVLRAMAAAGCWCVFFGIESMDQQSLDTINKNTDVQAIRRAVGWCRDAGIEVRANFIVGLPHDTPAKARSMLREICDLDLSYVKFSVLTPFPGTPLYHEIKAGKYGVMTDGFDRLTGHTATFVPFGYKDLDEVNETARWLTKRYYLRPRYMLGRFLAMRNLDDVRKNWRAFVALARA